MRKRIFAALAALACIFAAFSSLSCAPEKTDTAPEGSGTDQTQEQGTSDNDANLPPQDIEPENTTADSEKEARTDYFAALPAEDYGGREFIIAATDAAFADSDTDSGIIGGALYARNRAIEEKYNIKITVIPVEDSAVQASLQAAKSADAEEGENTGFADLLYVPMNTIGSCAGNGLLMNIYSVPFFNYDAEYCEPELLDSLSFADTAYGVYGEAAYDERSVWCVYYNKTVLEALGYDPVKMVKNGEWTWNNFLDIANLSVADLDENGRMNAASDRYGYASSMHTSSFANAVFASYGKQFFSTDEEGFLQMDFAETETDEYMTELRNICVSNKAIYPVRNPGAAALEAFSEGRLTFFCEKLSYASTLAYSPTDWGILPMPKRYSGQERHYSWVDSSVCGYAVPYGVADSALAGKVLNAIYAYNASYGGDTIQKAWTYYYLRDNFSAEMVGLAKDTACYDIAFAFGEGMADFSMVSYELIQSVMEKNVNFTNLYTQNQKPFSAFMRQEFVN